MADLDKCPKCRSHEKRVARMDCYDPWHHADGLRPEDAVACPACDKKPGDSCDGPSSHPSRLAAYAHPFRPTRVFKLNRVFITPTATPPRDWVINDIKIGNVQVPSPPIEPDGTMNFEIPASPARCPTCGSSDPAMRYGQQPAIVAIGVFWCEDTWHDQPQPEPARHAPRIARTLMEGPGNRTMVRGCSCGAEVMSDEAYAEHVGWPIEAVRAVLHLVGIADDLVLHHERMTRADDGQGDPHERLGHARDRIWARIARCLEVRR